MHLRNAVSAHRSGPFQDGPKYPRQYIASEGPAANPSLRSKHEVCSDKRGDAVDHDAEIRHAVAIEVTLDIHAAAAVDDIMQLACHARECAVANEAERIVDAAGNRVDWRQIDPVRLAMGEISDLSERGTRGQIGRYEGKAIRTGAAGHPVAAVVAVNDVVANPALDGIRADPAVQRIIAAAAIQ